VSDALLSGYDFHPTILDYLGLGAPVDPRKPGRSFAPLLRGEARDADAAVVVYDEYGPVRMVRTREWKYVHRHPAGPHELYDLVADPGERTNRFADRDTQAVSAGLAARLDAWFSRYVDPALDGRDKPVNGCGQLDLADIADARKAFAEEPVNALSVPTRPA
jgi:arylsulfatase A-like enzyme